MDDPCPAPRAASCGWTARFRGPPPPPAKMPMILNKRRASAETSLTGRARSPFPPNFVAQMIKDKFGGMAREAPRSRRS